MTEPTVAELQRKSEFIAGTISANRHTLALLKQEFAKSPEGTKVELLESALKYVVDFETFLEHFISGPPGNRTVDELVTRLEHPATGKPDEKLIKAIKGLATDFEKTGLPDLAGWKIIMTIKESARNIRTDEDIKKFREDIEGILARAKDLPEKLQNELDSALRGNSRLAALNNYEKALTLWRIILRRLAIPEDRLNPENIAVPKNIPEVIIKVLDGCGLADPENKDNVNWSAFPEKIRSEKTNSRIVKALAEFGHRDSAIKFLVVNLASARISRDEYVHQIAEHISTLRSHAEISKIELEAGKAVSEAAASILEKSKKQIDTLRRKFEEVMSTRVKEITGEHAKALDATTEIIRNTESHAKRAAMTSDLCADDYDRMIESEEEERKALAYALDILRLIKARIIFRQFESKSIDSDTMKKEIDEILASNPQRFVMDIINLLGSRVTMRLNNQLTVLEYDGEMRKIDSKIHEFVNQIPHVCRVLKMRADEIESLSSEYEAMRASALTDIDQTNRIAMEGDRRVRKEAHIDRYRRELPPEDWEVYQEAA